MGTTAQKLQRIEDTKTALGTVISSHGGTVPQTFAGYPAALAERMGALDALSDKTISELALPTAAQVGGYLCDGCRSLAQVNAPNVTTVNSYAFRDCSALREISLPNTTVIFGYAFQRCTSLASVHLPKLVQIAGTYAFQNCTALQTVDFPMLLTFNNYCFYGCTSLTTVTAASVTVIGSDAFRNCSNLREVRLPAFGATSSRIEARAFTGTPATLEVWLTALTAEQIKALSGFPWGAQGAAKFHSSDGYVLGDGTIVPA